MGLSTRLEQPIDTPPSVLFIAVDDLRDWTGYSNAFSHVKTPYLNALAQRATVFSHAYCSAPVCNPSRTSLLTGLSPATTGFYANAQRWPDDICNHVTLTRHFMDNGYTTIGFGKIYHGKGDIPYWHHFEYGDYSPSPTNPDHTFALGNPLDIPDSLTGDGMRVQNAINILQSDITGPLFLACGLVKPHTPWDVPRKYFDMYPLDSITTPPILSSDLDDIPLIGQKIAQKLHNDHYNGNDNAWSHAAIVDSGLWKINLSAYLACITFVDHQIGKLLQAWAKSPISENGIIVIWGDHGWHHGEKLHWSKRTLWEEGTLTPLMIYDPRYSQPGDIVHTPVSLLDIFPTLIELTGISLRDDLDGLSLAPLLKNNDLPWDRPAVTIYGKDNVAVRDSRWRYIHYCDGSKELYDHSVDPNEHTNLALDTQYTSVINNLHQWVPSCKAEAMYRDNKRNWFLNNQICIE